MGKHMFRMLTILWVVGFVLYSGWLGFYFYQVYQEKGLVEMIAKQNNETLDEVPFVLEGNVREAVGRYAKLYYYCVPEKIRNAFHEEGWQFILTDKDIASVYYHGPIEGRLAGLTDISEQSIYIHARKEDIRRALIHEFGHYFDYRLSMNSINHDEFKAIYKKEKAFFNEKWKIDDHAISNEQEYFASAFEQMILYPEVLKEDCPKTYSYLEKLLSISF